MNLLIKTEQGVVTEQYTEKLSVKLIESFISFILSENVPDIEFIKTLPLIKHIDPYADTYVNSTQAEIYIQEFKKLLEYTKDENLKQYCQIVVNELKSLPRNMFLVFSGD